MNEKGAFEGKNNMVFVSRMTNGLGDEREIREIREIEKRKGKR